MICVWVAYWLTAGLGRALGQVRWRFLLSPGESWSPCGQCGHHRPVSRSPPRQQHRASRPAGLTQPDTVTRPWAPDADTSTAQCINIGQDPPPPSYQLPATMRGRRTLPRYQLSFPCKQQVKLRVLVTLCVDTLTSGCPGAVMSSIL